ncbi:hypothetical protein BDFB_013147 [Asbolus verrucosus]|uniref:Mutator-like transposase domain-containing protein n=1 Tax=Asbolus verrucosus TaxID=1661398 RepID=A0A482W0K5_ASBVE|nr:hypothetical protein BDFB_013147 [Asbolus verrucosus]
MSSETYRETETKLFQNVTEIATTEMIKVGKKDHRLVIEAGEVDEDGLPLITLIADDAWSKRLYQYNYKALSGVNCIIGPRTQVSYVG